MRVGLVFGLTVALIFLPLTRSSSAGGGSPSSSLLVKENLDLPYDAGAFGEEEDEDAPDIVLLYGAAFEADAVVLCLDESKSMNKANRWPIQKREATRAIRELGSNTQFGIVFYGDDAHAFRPSLVAATQANKAAAISFIVNRQMSLGTCLGKGVIESLRMLQKTSAKRRAVIVAGDGRPTVCPFVSGAGRNPTMLAKLLQETRTANPATKVRVHTIYVGTSDDQEDILFMSRLAKMHSGSFRLTTQ